MSYGMDFKEFEEATGLSEGSTVKFKLGEDGYHGRKEMRLGRLRYYRIGAGFCMIDVERWNGDRWGDTGEHKFEHYTVHDETMGNKPFNYTKFNDITILDPKTGRLYGQLRGRVAQ